MLSDVLDRAISHPSAVVPSSGQGAVVRLGSLRLRVKALAVKGIFLGAQAITVVPALVMQAAGAGLGQPIVVPQLHQLDLFKAHVRAAPIVCEQMRTGNVLAAAGGTVGVGVIAREMCLADESRVVARSTQRSRKALRGYGLVQVDAVVMNATGQRQHTGQDGAS